jgi:type I restriction enzyme, S subunit
MMVSPSGWTAHKLDELGFVGRGRSRHRPRNEPSLYGGPYPFFQTGDIKAADLYLSKYVQTYNEKGLAQSKLWKPGTLCITIAANIAETAILAIAGCFPDSVVGFAPDSERADARFIKYAIDLMKLRMQTISRGTTQDNLSVDKLLSFDFIVPPVATQTKIADVLSAYDELIENNMRRIRILEEMAQALYEEWFVNFRFPYRERIKLVESPLGEIPQGWKIKKLGEIADVNASSIKRDGGPSEIDYVDISSVEVGRIQSAEHYMLADAPGRARRAVKHGDIIWSCVRPNRRSYALMLNPKPDLIVSTGFAVISAKSAPYSYLYHALTTDDFVGYLTNRARGAAYPAVTAEDFKEASVLLPPNELLDTFEDIASSDLRLAQDLHWANGNLRRTRDLLLPKLISGELDASQPNRNPLPAHA